MAKTVYIDFHKKFVKENISYTDKNGEEKTFNKVTLPRGTMVNGQNLEYYEFNPMFVNESKYGGSQFRCIPLLADREVWLKKPLCDENGKFLVDLDGKTRYGQFVKIMPQDLKDGIMQSKADYIKEVFDKEQKHEKVFIQVHERFVNENILGKGKNGEEKTYNKVVLPQGTVFDGVDLSRYEFCPLYVNQCRENDSFKSIPLLADREVWLKKPLRDGNGEFVRNAEGKVECDVIKIMPEQLNTAIQEQNSSYQNHSQNQEKNEPHHTQGRNQSLAEKGEHAKKTSEAINKTQRNFRDLTKENR